jgi:hypothetical protein
MRRFRSLIIKLCLAGASKTSARCRQSRLKIGNQINLILQPNRQPDMAWRYIQAGAIFIT